MQPVEFPGSRNIGKPENMTDEQCMAIPAANAIDEHGWHYWTTAWRPSYEDMKAFERGEPIYVRTICRDLPPMALFTLNEDGKGNDAG